MSVVLTFYKQIGHRESDIFIGTHSGPGDPPGEWNVLTMDKDLRKLDIDFRVISFPKDRLTLPEQLRDKVTWNPYFDLRPATETIGIAYPRRSTRTSTAIKKWVIETIATFDLSSSEEILDSENTDKQVVSSATSTDNTGDSVIPAVVGTTSMLVMLGGAIGIGKMAWNRWNRKKKLQESGMYIDEDGNYTDIDGRAIEGYAPLLFSSNNDQEL